jgi:hypothetical protein
MLWRAVDTAFAFTVCIVGLILFGCWSFMSGAWDGTPPSAPLAAQAVVQSAADRQFLATVNMGVPRWTPNTAIGIGQRVCGAFAEHFTRDQVTLVLTGKGIAAQDAEGLMQAAVAAYCPFESAHVAG